MAMKSGFFDYVRAAFSARPIGMMVPPNWAGLALFGLLGLVSPGFLVLGAGLELGYLYALVTNARFCRTVDAEKLMTAQRLWQNRQRSVIASLAESDRQKYLALEQRCRSILDQQGTGGLPGLETQGEGLGRLLWIYLTLLVMRQSVNRVRRESASGDGGRGSLEKRIAQIESRLKDEKLSEELKNSLTGQADILRQRQQKQQEAADKLAFLDAELVRIEEQAELIREQALLTTDPEVVSRRIDQISATLGGTTEWLREQQKIYGPVEDLLTEPPPLTASVAVKE